MRQKGYLIIVDITGYTKFLTQTELEHAEDILKCLLEALMERIQPPWVIHELEGDAIFAYTLDDRILQRQTLLETIENLYCAFALTREHIHHNSNCPCKACELAPSLDLKIVVHHGSFILSNIGGREKLTGPDVVLIHRLLKNRVIKTTGIQAYAFFTEACAEAMSLGELTAEMKPHSETYEHLGEVNGFVHDLSAVWAREKEKRRVYVDMEDLWFEIHVDLPVPPALAWDYVNAPENRRRWTQADRITVEGLSGGRIDVGTGLHCAHGKQSIKETIVDWRPFDYMTMDSVLPLKGGVRITSQLTPIDGGTRLSWYADRPTGQNAIHTFLLRLIFAPIKRMLTGKLKEGGDIIRAMIEADRAGGQAVPEGMVEMAQSG
ncbi:MAG: DUF2652 domain-containing protein [Candidatus Poribacteria bacterium]|nr:DUF2652 domain-containing protein [Candidatus Poribacteria bacterium]